ncbi:MAG: RNA polymerase sigma factor [Winogradskyella sp.]|uniref:RNA polymerase sigma factor n=1 Tax=Winogradskyella sp. TaxID=1883156 RepID=UPI000F4031AC|nr:RNA polymerase sigma factor [Winogradskyella sp.]RNC86386.1 MAG: RNA polymerase sigma factor [Winogradskyella sp.]
MTIENDFTEIYNRYSDKILRLCLGYANGDEDLAKEWLQETFIKVWKHRKSFKGHSSIDTWIYRIAVNTCLSDLRQRKKMISIDKELGNAYESDEPKKETELKIKKMYHCIDKLTPQNKGLILLELENIPQTTIAQTHGLAHGTLRTRLSRIRKSLLKCITNGK